MIVGCLEVKMRLRCGTNACGSSIFIAEKAEAQRRREIMIVGCLEVKMRLRCGTKLKWQFYF